MIRKQPGNQKNWITTSGHHGQKYNIRRRFAGEWGKHLYLVTGAFLMKWRKKVYRSGDCSPCLSRGQASHHSEWVPIDSRRVSSTIRGISTSGIWNHKSRKPLEFQRFSGLLVSPRGVETLCQVISEHKKLHEKWSGKKSEKHWYHWVFTIVTACSGSMKNRVQNGSPKSGCVQKCSKCKYLRIISFISNWKKAERHWYHWVLDIWASSQNKRKEKEASLCKTEVCSKVFKEQTECVQRIGEVCSIVFKTQVTSSDVITIQSVKET